MKHNINMYRNEFFLTLTDKELIAFCTNPPKDCEFAELKTAADVIAKRYAACIKYIDTRARE